MKRLLAVLCAAVLFTFSAAAYSNGELGVSFEQPEGYMELNAENISKHEGYLSLLNHSEESFKKYLTDNNIEFFALTNDNKKQIILRCYETEFSKQLVDMSAVADEDVETIAKAVLPEGSSGYSRATVNGIKYIQVITSGEDSGGGFSAVQYITIRNGLFFSMVYNYSESTLQKSSLDASFQSMTKFNIENFKAASVWSLQDIFTLIMVIVFMIIVAAVIIIILYSFVKDIIAKRRESQGGGEVKVKRRKFKR